MNYDELTAENLERMQEVDIRTVNIEDLTDLKDINIDTKLPVKEKLRSFAEQSSNLYIHRVGNFVVKVSFQKEGPTINDKMKVETKEITIILVKYVKAIVQYNY